MKLRELIQDLDIMETRGSLDQDVTGIAYHTGKVEPGCLFTALVGVAADGHKYVGGAIERGAKVIVSQRVVPVSDGITNIVVQNARLALALISARFFGEPSKKFRLIGITGTNGKTTITYLLESIFNKCGFNTGVVGTVNYRYGSVLTNPAHTTPESYDLQKLFGEMLSFGVDSVAMEVSSHSLDQDRVAGCYFDGAIFTNLTQDHLDYHLDMQRYKSAKACLFKKYLPNGEKKDPWAVMNADDAAGREIAGELKYPVYLYSVREDADISLANADYSFKGVDLEIKLGRELLKLKSPLVGSHNASNILAAIGAAFAMQLPLSKIKEGVEGLKRVPGRLEPVPNSKGLQVLIDYAHTPDALKNVTLALKELKPKRLITVFGCGGDRDKSKRPLMGYETAMRSDLVIITSDNPRSEDPRKIIDEIVGGVKDVGLVESNNGSSGYIVEVNRREAISKALHLARKDDVVLIAGKGHEDYQIIGKEKYPFDDLKVAVEIIEML